MSTTEVSGNERGGNPSVPGVDLKLEVVAIPVSDVDRAKEFYGRLGWRLDADLPFDNGFRVVQFTPPGSGGSIQFGTNLTSAAPARPRVCIWSSPISRQRAGTSSPTVSRSARCSTPGRRVLSSSAMAPAVVSAGPRPITKATALSRRSATPTATAGWCRRSRRGCPAGSTRPRRCSRRPRTWRARFGGPRPPTANMRSASGRPTRTGPNGTPRTWQQSRPAGSCRRERRLRHHRPGCRSARRALRCLAGRGGSEARIVAVRERRFRSLRKGER